MLEIHLKGCTQYFSKFGKLISGHTREVLIPIPMKGNAKECLNYSTTVLIAHASKVMFNILHTRLYQHNNWPFSDVQAGFQKVRRVRNQIVNICCIMGKTRDFQKNTYFCFIDYIKALTVRITTNWEILKEMGIPDHLICLLRNLYAGQEATVRTGHELRTCSRLGKEYIKAVYCHPAYLIYMQSTSWKMPGGMKHKL